MADSHVAATVQLIQSLTQDLTPALGGISPVPLPHNATYTYITVLKYGGKELESLSGRSGYYTAMMQINCWDSDYEAADQMRETIKSLLLSYAGPAGTLTIAGINHQMDGELYEPEREVHLCLVRLQVVWIN